ncbi:nuclear transport factor 2 family protein [Reichenbachiella sp.]|uniref:nuclear transport factor 2 family protein n=1 Tax=Reichenbachiella sp. TaxID=2184521 RepID=UPI003297B0CA
MKIIQTALIMMLTVSGIAQPIKVETETKEDEIRSFNEYVEVEKALSPYIESAKTGDGILSRSAFYDHAYIVGSVGGEFSAVSADEFAKVISSTGPSKNIKHHIAWIDISGPAAAAKVEFIDWAGLRCTDFFVLYKKWTMEDQREDVRFTLS